MTFDQADYFLVPLLDGQFGVGQILEADSHVPFCALTALRVTPQAVINPFSAGDIIAFVRISPAGLRSGTWPLAGFDQIPTFRHLIDYDGSKALDFPDHPIHDPAVIEAFLSAWHGLYPWDAFGDLFEKIKRTDLDRPIAAT